MEKMTRMGKTLLTALIGAASVASASAAPAASNPKIDVEGVSKFVYPANAPAGPGRMSYMPDGLTYLRLEDGGRKIVKYDTTTGKQVETIFDATHTREASVRAVQDFSISPDGTKLLMHTDRKDVYRRSFTACYYVFEIKRNILRPLSENNPRQQSPVFSPNGRMVAYVADNNIYIKKIDYNSEVQVTTDGEKNRIINGIPDWTYEEEFSTSCSMTWAPDNSTLCFLRFDEASVPMFTFSLYEGWCDPQKEYALYPGQFTYKYPVAGQPNSVVSVHSYDVETRKIKEIALKDSRIEYIPRIEFGADNPDRLMLVTLNREQNRMEIYAANPKSTVSKSVIVEESKAWLNPQAYEDLVFEKDGFTLLSERTGWNGIYKYSYAGQEMRRVSAGSCDVTAYYGTDAQGYVYFQSVPPGAEPSNAINRAVYRVDRQGKKTEALTPVEGWNSASFAPGLAHYVLNSSSANTPPVYTLCNSKGKKVRDIQNNSDYAARFRGVGEKEFFTFNSGSVTLNGYVLKPAGMKSGQRYPVIMWQYSGPGSQSATNRWAMDWDYYAVQQGFVVVCVDGRGTGNRGTAFRDVVYKNLGHYETIDQIAAAKYVASLPYADGNRIGLAGWSYGGYETLMGVTDPACPWKAGVAIAPVTSWRYYDTVYAERYMLTPQANEEGYNESAPVNRVENMNVPLLIMHGTSDDNVHLSNTMEFVSRLQGADRYCELFLFPNMNHSIYGCDARALVYGRMIGFFKANL